MEPGFSATSRIVIHCGRRIQVGKAPFRALVAMLRTRTVGEYMEVFDAELAVDPIPGDDTAEGILRWLHKVGMVTFDG